MFFFNYVNIIIIIRNKNYIYLIYINNKLFNNIFIIYNINNLEKRFFIRIFYII